MWVYEEMIPDGNGSTEKLTDIINSRHENVKYLPSIQLPKNVVAVADLAQAAQGATLLIFVLPHQFLPKLLPAIRKHAHPNCRGVSLIKGLGESDGSLLILFGGMAILPPFLYLLCTPNGINLLGVMT